MFSHSSNTASFFSILIAALIFSLALAGLAAAQGNTSLGTGALQNNTTGSNNTAIGEDALFSNSMGDFNTASGVNALVRNTTGSGNTASGSGALFSNIVGNYNTAIGSNAGGPPAGNGNTIIGSGASVSSSMLGGNDFNTVIGFRAAVAFGGAFSNATAIGYDARVNAPNKIRLGNTQVTVIEGQVAFTASSDKTQKENFKPVDGEEVLRKISGLS